MMDLFAYHSGIDITLDLKGDTHIDYHHSVEDAGICLGVAFREALGDCIGINRYANISLPMDEALCNVALDISNRSFLVFNWDPQAGKVGDFDIELVEEFFVAFTNNARITLHIDVIRGTNNHHIIESIFKAVAQSIKQAIAINPKVKTVPSTKGLL